MIVVDTETGKVMVNPDHIITVLNHEGHTYIVCRDDCRIVTTDSVEDIWKQLMVE